jgi:ABC-2 type transport system ATP-binding protein
MRRRLDLALSLVHRPPILFLDEPTTGLDPQSRRAMWALIKDLRDQGATILLTTQYLEEADELAERVAVIDAGRIVALGTPDELKGSVGRTTVAFRLQDPSHASRLPGIVAGAEPVMTGDRVRLEIEGNGSHVTDLLVALRNGNIAYEGLSVSEPTLEDVFVRLTGEEMDVSTSSDRAVGVSAVSRFRSAGSRRQG